MCDRVSAPCRKCLYYKYMSQSAETLRHNFYEHFANVRQIASWE